VVYGVKTFEPGHKCNNEHEHNRNNHICATQYSW